MNTSLRYAMGEFHHGRIQTLLERGAESQEWLDTKIYNDNQMEKKNTVRGNGGKHLGESPFLSLFLSICFKNDVGRGLL